MAGRLSTHVLDTARGRPASGLVFRLYRIEGDGARLISEQATNADGRANAPLLEGAAMQPGTYEIRFLAGDYQRRMGLNDAEPLFLDVIPIRFGISAADQHYHVPLLLAPYSYSTYRGS